MKRVYILCEGQSEEVFIRQVLAPYFININSQHCLIPIVTKTSAGHKGGGLKYHRIKKEILALLNHKEAFVSTFFDYYALPNDFPKYDKQSGDIYEKIAILERTITHIRERCSHFNKWCDKIASLQSRKL